MTFLSLPTDLTARKCDQTSNQNLKIKKLTRCIITFDKHPQSDPAFTFLADSRFSEWLGKSSSVRLCCLSRAGIRSALASASTVESLCEDDSSAKATKGSFSAAP